MEKEPTVLKYIDPMVDFGFKKIFKESGNKQFIIRPLNAVFDLNIVDVDITESEQLGLTEQERRASYDMRCTTRDGRTFLIEVQLADQTYFMERAIFYSARTISAQAARGKWNYKIGPVFFLGLLNFDIRHLDPQLADPQQFIHKFSLREDQTGELMSSALRFAFMEIARFDKPKEACITFEDRFLYIMKNLPTFAEKPELWDDPYFDEMIQEAEFANMTFEEQEAYIQAMKSTWDYNNSLEFAEARGKANTAVEIARKLLALGVSIDVIQKGTGLSAEQIQTLQGES